MKRHSSISFAGVAAMFVTAMFVGSVARADVLIERNVMVTTPSVPVSESLTLTSAGILTVTVTDLAWPQALQSLSFAISNHTGVLTQRTGSGSLMYDIAAPGAFFANVYAIPSLSGGVGLYHFNVSFAPTVVPLPAAGWLLLSGLVAVGRFARRSRGKTFDPSARALVTNAGVQ